MINIMSGREKNEKDNSAGADLSHLHLHQSIFLTTQLLAIYIGIIIITTSTPEWRS